MSAASDIPEVGEDWFKRARLVLPPGSVTCPCCHGTGNLTVHDQQYDQTLTMFCCHCQGKGCVIAEQDRTSDGGSTVAVQE